MFDEAAQNKAKNIMWTNEEEEKEKDCLLHHKPLMGHGEVIYAK